MPETPDNGCQVVFQVIMARQTYWVFNVNFHMKKQAIIRQWAEGYFDVVKITL